MLKRSWAMVLVLGWAGFTTLLARADDAKTPSGGAALEGAVVMAQLGSGSVRNIVPVFGQLVSFAMPKGFVPAFEEAKGNFYIWEAVPDGETTSAWTQMLTLTGLRGLVVNANVNAEAIAVNIAKGFQRTCPDTFGVANARVGDIGGKEAFGVVVSCGIANPKGPKAAQYSESALVVAIKGYENYYTLQWAERGAAVPARPKIEVQKWVPKLKLLDETRLCALIPEEQPPYPSCR